MIPSLKCFIPKLAQTCLFDPPDVQIWVLQFPFSDEDPTQLAPPPDGGGLLQTLVLD